MIKGMEKEFYIIKMVILNMVEFLLMIKKRMVRNIHRKKKFKLY